MDDPRRLVPRTDALLADPRLAEAERVLGRTLVKAVVAQAQQRARAGEIEPDQVAEHAVAALPLSAASLRPVINATGVVVHTNLGRAPLSQAALDAVITAGGATDVEFDLVTGRRESINFQLRKITKNRGHFPDKDAAMKLLYLGLRNISSERGGFSGTGTYNWTVALNTLARLFPGRIPLC